MSKLIVIRGNSGSGKSTLASLVHSGIKNSIIIDQDYYIKYTPDTKTPAQEKRRKQRIFDDIKSALDCHDVVIIEGVFDSRRYTDNFIDLLHSHPTDNYFYYLDIPFVETLRRHQGREKRDMFGEAEMTGWYAPHDQFGYEFEVIFNEHDSLTHMLGQIYATASIKLPLVDEPRNLIPEK